MKKISNWQEIQEGGLLLPPGPQVCRIFKVVDIEDKEYLEIYFDISHGEYKGYFSEQKEQFGLEKWPNAGILRRSYKKKALGFFKRFITAVEKSNPNYLFNFNEQTLVNKFVVVVFGIEEWENQDGEVKDTIKPQDCRSIQAFKEGKIPIPKKKTLSGNDTRTTVGNSNPVEEITPQPKPDPEEMSEQFGNDESASVKPVAEPEESYEENDELDLDDLPF